MVNSLNLSGAAALDEVVNHPLNSAQSQSVWRQRSLENFITGSAAGLALSAVLLQVRPVLEGSWWQLGTLLFYSMVFALILVRRPSRATSNSVSHWIVALSGVFLPFAVRLESSPPSTLFWLGLPLQLAGMAVSLIALFYLGRSFGIIAAHRKIQCQGPYRIVRHPLYMGEALWFTGIVLQNLCWFNLMIICIQLGCQIRRILEEESLLSGDPQYADYMRVVPSRLVPGVF